MHIVVLRDVYSAPFFDGCARGELLLRHCSPCDTFAAPEIRECAQCGAPLEWRATSGRGSLVTWTTVLTDAAANAAGIVQLDEGPWIYARTAIAEARAGLRLSAHFERPNDDGQGEFVPVFVDVAAPQAG